MRVLVVGKRNGTLHWLENVMDGFAATPDVEARAFCVNHFGYLDQLWKNIVKRCSRDLLDQIIADRFARELEKFKPQLILIVDCFYIPDAVFEIIASPKNTSLVAWWIGDLFDRDLVAQHDFVDKFYFSDSHFIDYAAETGIFNTGYLPLAYNPAIFRFLNQGPRDKRLAFVGAYSANRARIVSEFTDPMLVVGKKWHRMNAPQHEVRPRRVTIAGVAEIYNRHVGVLNIKNSGNVVNGLNMRTFDAPACGCVVINDKLSDLDRCFDVGKEVLVYNCPEELNDHYARIASDENERIKIAEAGRRRVQAEHQYSHRIRTILQDLF